MPQPLLDVGDVRVVIEGVGGGRRAERVQAKPVHVDPGRGRIGLHPPVDAVSGDPVLQRAGPVVSDRTEEGTLAVLSGQVLARVGWTGQAGKARVKAELRGWTEGEALLQTVANAHQP